MGSIGFFATAVGAGFVLIGLVVYSYVRPHPQHRPSVTALLGLLGFALVASPNWTSISLKGEGLELSLIREMQARQLRALADLEPPDDASPADAAPMATPRPTAARTRALAGASAVRTPPAASAASPRPLPAGAVPETRPQRELPEARRKELFEAFDRGELDLATLSNRELLSLNERLTKRE